MESQMFLPKDWDIPGTKTKKTRGEKRKIKVFGTTRHTQMEKGLESLSVKRIDTTRNILLCGGGCWIMSKVRTKFLPTSWRRDCWNRQASKLFQLRTTRNEVLKNKGQRVWSESQLTALQNFLNSIFLNQIVSSVSDDLSLRIFYELIPFQISTKLATRTPPSHLNVTNRQQASEINWLPNHTHSQHPPNESNANFIQQHTKTKQKRGLVSIKNPNSSKKPTIKKKIDIFLGSPKDGAKKIYDDTKTWTWWPIWKTK